MLVEGGPSLNGALAGAGLLDELCLSLSPRLVGGDAEASSPAPRWAEPRHLELRSVCEEDGFLFVRFTVE